MREIRESEKPSKIRIYTEELKKYEQELEKMGDRKISVNGNRKETIIATIKNLKFQLTKLS